jgi:hypothetical protein
MPNSLGIDQVRSRELYDELLKALKAAGTPLTMGNGLVYIRDSNWTLEEKLTVASAIG